MPHIILSYFLKILWTSNHPHPQSQISTLGAEWLKKSHSNQKGQQTHLNQKCRIICPYRLSHCGPIFSVFHPNSIGMHAPAFWRETWRLSVMLILVQSFKQQLSHISNWCVLVVEVRKKNMILGQTHDFRRRNVVRLWQMLAEVGGNRTKCIPKKSLKSWKSFKIKNTWTKLLLSLSSLPGSSNEHSFLVVCCFVQVFA